MLKVPFIFTLLFFTQATFANWSDYTFLGTLENVVFSYRTFTPSEISQGEKVQFRVINLNSMTTRMRITDKKFHCYDGSVESAPQTRARVKGGETEEFTPHSNVCAGRGGLKYLNVSIDARVRR